MISSKFYTANDVADMLSVSKTTAYRIIRRLNEKLAADGYVTVSGRVPKRYFDAKFYC